VTELSNEVLMAYADGELDPSSAAEVEIRIASHLEYQELVRVFKSTRDPVQRAFCEVMDERMSERAVAALRGRDVCARHSGFADLGRGVLRALTNRGARRFNEIAIAIASRLARYTRRRADDRRELQGDWAAHPKAVASNKAFPNGGRRLPGLPGGPPPIEQRRRRRNEPYCNAHRQSLAARSARTISSDK
jgi:anti-sigma factor RsiW